MTHTLTHTYTHTHTHTHTHTQVSILAIPTSVHPFAAATQLCSSSFLLAVAPAEQPMKYSGRPVANEYEPRFHHAPPLKGSLSLAPSLKKGERKGQLNPAYQKKTIETPAKIFVKKNNQTISRNARKETERKPRKTRRNSATPNKEPATSNKVQRNKNDSAVIANRQVDAED